MEAVSRIKQLIPSLPEKDRELGYKFLESRDFEFLQDLVNSTLYKVRKAKIVGDISNKLMAVDIDELRRLKSEIDTYVFRLEIYDMNNNTDNEI